MYVTTMRARQISIICHMQQVIHDSFIVRTVLKKMSELFLIKSVSLFLLLLFISCSSDNVIGIRALANTDVQNIVSYGSKTDQQ